MTLLVSWTVPIFEPTHAEPQLIDAVIEFCLAAAFGTLWWSARDFRIFRSMSVYTGMIGLQLVLLYVGAEAASRSVMILTAPLILRIACEAMGVSQRRWMAGFWAISGISFFWNWTPTLRFLRDWPLNLSLILLGVVIVVVLLRKKRRNPWIVASFLLLFLVRWLASPEFHAVTGLPAAITIHGWAWPIPPMSTILMGVLTLGVFARELVRDRQEKLRLSTELEAARAVQQVLVPESLPIIAGYTVSGTYRPAQEVGGDFYQVIQLGNEAALLAIGDVSGKGLPAAMAVAMIVGAIRSTVEASTRPGMILAALNRALMGRSGGGFTTCLVLRADADGALTMANAGHIAPYFNGSEVELENGLPLGLANDAAYAESSIILKPGQQLTLMTDGVVEARATDGELLGFERVAAMARGAAAEIADAAQAFGQDDDITVVTITRSVAEVSHD